MPGKFSEMRNAKATVGGVYLLPGIFLVEIQRCKSDVTRRGIGNYIVEFRIVESTCADRAVGSTASWYQGLDKEGVFGRIKSFLMAVNGVEEHELSDDEWEKAAEESVSEANPLAGARVRVQVTEATSKAGKKVHNHAWSRA